MNRLPILAILVFATGCTTYKLWNEAGSDQESATVDLSYEFRKFENPQVDERAAIQMARERCRDWRFTDAHRKSETRECLDGSEANCGKWRVTRRFQCTK
jgi:hypothetical protein